MDITSNWSTENGLQIHEIIQESDNLPLGDLVDLLDEDKCISLVRTPHEHCKECTIKFASKSGWDGRWKDPGPQKRKLISGIMILSEARLVEICIGVHEEYHKTVHGTLMGDFGDSKIYMCQVKFDNPQEVIVLKLKALCLDDSVWIYGFHIATTMEVQTPGAGHVTSHFSGDHLSAVLKEKGVHMSKQAIKFRQVLEGFNTGISDRSNKFVGNNPMAFMSMMFGTNSSKTRESELDLKNGNKNDDTKEIIKGKDSLNMSDLLGLIENHLSPKSDEKLYNGDIYPPSSMKKEAMYNIQNNEKDQTLSNKSFYGNGTNVIVSEDKVSISEGKNIKDSSPQIANILETLQDISCDGNHGNAVMRDNHKYRSLMDVLSKSGPISKPVMESNWSSCNLLHQSGNVKTVNGKADCKCVNDTEAIVNNLEKIVDTKLAAMEERLLKKIEQKFEEKTLEDSLRLKRIEELFTKIYDKL